MDIRKLNELLAAGQNIFTTELTVAYYARVSTDKDEQLNSLDNQKRYFEEYIRSNSHWTFAGGYVDEGISGASVAGPDYHQGDQPLCPQHAGQHRLYPRTSAAWRRRIFSK